MMEVYRFCMEYSKSHWI